MISISDIKNTYPLVIVPPELRDAFKREIPLDLEEPSKPNYPYSNNPGPWGCLILPGAFLLIILLSEAVEPKTVGILALILLIVVVAYWINLSIDNGRKQTLALKEYEGLLKSYEYKKQQFDLHKMTVREESKTKVFRLNLAKEIASKGRLPNVKSNHKIGKSEAYFENYLNRWFPERIFKGYALLISPDCEPYQPDFIYQDDNNLHIDIEIDEPYISDTKEPIHYIDEFGLDSDTGRNSFFTEQSNWIVIRFCEEQVISSPNECCYVIAETIYTVTGEHGYVNNLSSFGYPRQFERWSKHKAKQFGFINYRETYLSGMRTDSLAVNIWNDCIRLKSIQFLSKEEIEKIKRQKREEESKPNSQYNDDLPF